jgi:hypothetical protein
MRLVYASEAGFWVVPDLRFGLGYNFTGITEPAGSQISSARRGFYFTITSKLSNLFDLFGKSKHELVGTGAGPAQPDKK